MAPTRPETTDETPIDVLVRELDELLDACFMEEVAPALEDARRARSDEAA